MTWSTGFAHRSGKRSSAPWASRAGSSPDPAQTSRVGLVVEIPDMEGFQRLMQSDEAAEAMRSDGVRPETLVLLEEASEHL